MSFDIVYAVGPAPYDKTEMLHRTLDPLSAFQEGLGDDCVDLSEGEM